MNYFPFHVGDWVLHTSHLSPEEEAVYLRLLCHYYDTEKPIPEETNPVIRRLRLGSQIETVRLILSEFFTLEDDGWHNARADREIKAYNDKAKKARENGKKGGRPKTYEQPEKKTNPVISGLAKKTQTKANQEPITNNQEPNIYISANADISAPKKPKQKSLDSFDVGDDAIFAEAGDLQSSELELWRAIRKAKLKSGSAITEQVWKRHCTEAYKAGISPAAAVRFCNFKNWAGFNSKWYQNEQSAGAHYANNQRLTAKQEQSINAGRTLEAIYAESQNELARIRGSVQELGGGDHGDAQGLDAPYLSRCIPKL